MGGDKQSTVVEEDMLMLENKAVETLQNIAEEALVTKPKKPPGTLHSTGTHPHTCKKPPETLHSACTHPHTWKLHA